MENADWFRGDFRETQESLREAEERLGVSLSEELKWLLLEWGCQLPPPKGGTACP
jgi:hypothetical protein